MANPSVSVLMNCFNGERFIREAISSVLAQTEADFELLVWDNQSTDHSADIIQSFDDSRIRYHRSDRHTSLAEARRLALPLLRGEWIGFLDVDDLWRHDKLEKQLNRVREAPEVGFCYCAVNLLDQSNGDGSAHRDHVFNRQPNTLPEGRIFQRLLRGNFIAIASLLVNRRKLVDLGGLRGRYPIMEDYDMSLRLARHHTVAVVPEVLCDYRVHGNNDSLRGPLDHFEDLDIVRSHFPHPMAILAAGRIAMRHFKKSFSAGRSPRIGALLHTLILGLNRTHNNV